MAKQYAISAAIEMIGKRSGKAQEIINAGVEDYTTKVAKAVEGYDPADADIVLTALATIRDRVTAGKRGDGKPEAKKGSAPKTEA